MKLSVEAKVAASVAVAFVALTVGVIAQGNTADQSVGPNGIWHDREAGVRTDMSQHGYDSYSVATPTPTSRDIARCRIRCSKKDPYLGGICIELAKVTNARC